MKTLMILIALTIMTSCTTFSVVPNSNNLPDRNLRFSGVK